MQVFSLSKAKNNIKAIFDSVILIFLDEYNGYKETNYLLESPNNKKHLLSSLKELREGRGFEKELLK